MPSQKNIDQIQKISESLQSAKAIYMLDYQGLGVNDLNQLRKQIREAGGQLMVAKNTLFVKALNKIEPENPCYLEIQTASSDNRQLTDKDILTGNTGFLFAYEDQIQPLKVVVKFAKDNELPNLKLGLVNHQVLNDSQVLQLSKLPGIDQLRAQVVGMIQSPISGFVNVLNGNLNKLVVVLDQIKQQKSN